MLKKCSCLALILGAISPAFALYWGVFDDYKQNIDNFAMVKFLNNKPIEYHLTTAQKPIKPTDNPSEDLKNQLNPMIPILVLIQHLFCLGNIFFNFLIAFTYLIINENISKLA